MSATSCSFTTITRPDGYRQAVASSDIPAGTIVSSESSLATVLFRSQSHRCCSFCLSSFSEDNGKRCLGGCEYNYYCSRDCQLNDFPIHKHSCKKYHKIVGNAVKEYVSERGATKLTTAETFSLHDFPWEDFFLARKVYIKLCIDSNVNVKQQHSVNDVMLPEEIRSLSTGEDTPNGGKEYPDEIILAAMVSASFRLDPCDSIPFFESLVCKFRCNNFGIQNSMQTVIGHGVFPTGAKLNHSCDPNCILTYQGDKQIIRTISKSVKEGRELFHSYTDICQPTQIRRVHLQNIYGFVCHCNRCEGKGRWKEVEDAITEQNGYSENDQMQVNRAIQTAQQISADNVDDDMESVRREYDCLRDALSIQKKKLGPFHLERYKTECLALGTSMLLDGGHVVEHAENAVKFLRYVLNKYHPLVLLQEMTLAELYIANGKQLQGKDMIQLLIERCELSLGIEYEYIPYYRKLLDDMRGH